MTKEKIWLALVGVKRLDGNKYIDTAGAYVSVAGLAGDEAEFISKLNFNFKHNKFEVFEIEDIETENSLTTENTENAEKLKLIDELKEGYKFAWGIFHTFDNP